MNKPEENIPTEIFDWINNYSFHNLSAAQQSQVIIWFSPDTYNQIHLAAKQASYNQEWQARKAAIKDQLLYQFEAKNKSKVWYKKTIPWWQAAAAILVIAGIFTTQLLKQQTAVKENLLAFTDTIYLEKLVASEPIYIYDTVYQKETKNVNQSPVGQQKQTEKAMENFKNTALPNQVLVQSIHTLESTSNQIKGNSLKDDTLLLTYGFVKL